MSLKPMMRSFTSGCWAMPVSITQTVTPLPVIPLACSLSTPRVWLALSIRGRKVSTTSGISPSGIPIFWSRLMEVPVPATLLRSGRMVPSLPGVTCTAKPLISGSSAVTWFSGFRARIEALRLSSFPLSSCWMMRLTGPPLEETKVSWGCLSAAGRAAPVFAAPVLTGVAVVGRISMLRDSFQVDQKSMPRKIRLSRTRRTPLQIIPRIGIGMLVEI